MNYVQLLNQTVCHHTTYIRDVVGDIVNNGHFCVKPFVETRFIPRLDYPDRFYLSFDAGRTCKVGCQKFEIFYSKTRSTNSRVKTLIFLKRP